MTAASAHDGGVARLTGAVLVGGASRRMGTDKATLLVDGRPLANAVAEALRDAGCDPVLAVGRDAHSARELTARLGISVVPDRWPGAGPLGGVLTALEHAGTDVVVAACDLLALDARTVATVVRAGEASNVAVAVARTDRLQPVLARWNLASLPALRTAFAEGERSLVGALSRLVAVEVTVDADAVRDADTPDDLPPRAAGG